MKKRSNGEGSVYRLANGKWRGLVADGYDNNGKLRRVSFVAQSKADVLQKMREYTEMRLSGILNAKDLTLGAWLDAWYENYKTQVQPSTYANYKYTLNTIKKLLGHMLLKEVMPMHIDAMLDALSNEGYSDSKIRKCRAMLIQMFDSAVSNNLVLRNPARYAKKIRKLDCLPEDEPTCKDAFTEEEIVRMEKGLPNNILGNSILLMLNSGLRPQEILALKKEDIALDGSTVSVSRAVKTVNGCAVIGPPKSKYSRRVIPIPLSGRKYAVQLRVLGGTPYLWSSQGKNEAYNVGSFRRRYYTALKELDVRRLSPHCCRHTYVTNLEAHGVPMELIVRLAGHSEVKTTNRYLHTSLETLTNAVSSINRTSA